MSNVCTTHLFEITIMSLTCLVSFSLADMSVENLILGIEKKLEPKSILILNATVTFHISITAAIPDGINT